MSIDHRPPTTDPWIPLFTVSEPFEGREVLDDWAPAPDGLDPAKARQVTYEAAGRLLDPESFPLQDEPVDEQICRRAAELSFAMQIWRDLHDDEDEARPDIAGFTILLLEEAEDGTEGEGSAEGAEDEDEEQEQEEDGEEDDGEQEGEEDGEDEGEDEEEEGQEGEEEGEGEEEDEGDDEEGGEEDEDSEGTEGTKPDDEGEGEDDGEEDEGEGEAIGVIESEHDTQTELLAKLLPSLRHGVGDPTTNVDSDKLEELARRFQDDPHWRKLLDVIGRLSQSAWSPPARVPSTAREDVIDLELGADPSRIIASELARFGVEELSTLAWVDFVERRMPQIQVEGSEPRSNGPILVGIDSSGSMECDSGLGMNRVKLAVVLLMSLVRIADIQHRKLWALGFDSSVLWEKRVHTPAEAVDATLFLMGGVPCGGGTAFDPPLRLLLERSKQDGRGGADILMITDGEACVSQDVEKELGRMKKATGLRLFSLLISSSPHTVLDDLSDVVVRLSSWEDLERLTEQVAAQSRR